MNTFLRMTLGAIAFSSFMVAAQPSHSPAPPSNTTNLTVQPTQPNTISKQDAELLLIKEQNKMFKDFQSSQQSTVYWALSGIMSFVIILTGLSIFTNFKFYAQDKERLKKDLDSRLSEYRAELNLRTEEYLRESDRISEARNQNLQDRILNQISETRQFMNDIRAELTTEIKNSNTTTLDLEKLTRQRIAFVESTIRDVEVLVWDLRGIPSNMIVTHSQAVSAAIESGSKERVSHMLSQLIRTLEKKYIIPNEPIQSDTLKWLDDCLTKAFEIDPENVEKTRESISRVTVSQS
ncbi:hypothetical protein [Pseudomonas carassii]|uniref:Uncharacterized protein n=1 Tax=Pseudomonas carassii TaxID=3115855 RepID=A0ABU7HDX5_9PSED|nr:hypothetical protein [Pseudomonas sp. 137P]MEE1889520.1 hypothetical protein [Pseudomonas sp. 137P]